MSDCIFCAMVNGDVPCRRIYEDADSLAFLDVAPATRGHTLVIPRRHVRDIWDLPEAVAGNVGVATAKVATLLRDRLAPAGLNVMQANGEAAWQSVFHLHVHLVPRYDADELTRAWTPTLAPEEELDAVLREVVG
jgi:histidine triad (HIT) family protein